MFLMEKDVDKQNVMKKIPNTGDNASLDRCE